MVISCDKPSNSLLQAQGPRAAAVVVRPCTLAELSKAYNACNRYMTGPSRVPLCRLQSLNIVCPTFMMWREKLFKSIMTHLNASTPRGIPEGICKLALSGLTLDKNLAKKIVITLKVLVARQSATEVPLCLMTLLGTCLDMSAAKTSI